MGERNKTKRASVVQLVKPYHSIDSFSKIKLLSWTPFFCQKSENVETVNDSKFIIGSLYTPDLSNVSRSLAKENPFV